MIQLLKCHNWKKTKTKRIINIINIRSWWTHTGKKSKNGQKFSCYVYHHTHTHLHIIHHNSKLDSISNRIKKHENLHRISLSDQRIYMDFILFFHYYYCSWRINSIIWSLLAEIKNVWPHQKKNSVFFYQLKHGHFLFIIILSIRIGKKCF